MARQRQHNKFIWLGLSLVTICLAILLTLNLSGRQLDQRLFYLVLLLFGVGVSALLFGGMNSIGQITGKQGFTEYSFTGPIVGVILVVVGYFHFNPNEKFTLQFHIFGENKLPIKQGELTVYLDEPRTKPVTPNGEVQFQGITSDHEGTMSRVIIVADGYETYVNDSVAISRKSIDLYLNRVYNFTISGRVLTAAEIPIEDAEVNIKNTSYLDVTRTGGYYTIDVTGFKGDRIILVTSHPNYQDKEVEVQLTTNPTIKQDLFVAPNSNPTGSYQ